MAFNAPLFPVLRNCTEMFQSHLPHVQGGDTFWLSPTTVLVLVTFPRACGETVLIMLKVAVSLLVE